MASILNNKSNGLEKEEEEKKKIKNNHMIKEVCNK